MRLYQEQEGELGEEELLQLGEGGARRETGREREKSRTRILRSSSLPRGLVYHLLYAYANIYSISGLHSINTYLRIRSWWHLETKPRLLEEDKTH